MIPAPKVMILLALSGCLITSAIRSLNFLMYLDNEPVVIQAIISFRSPMVSEVEAVGTVAGVFWACALCGSAGNSVDEFILGGCDLGGALVTPLLSLNCCAMGQPR